MLVVLATAKILYSAAVSKYCSDNFQSTAIGDVSDKNSYIINHKITLWQTHTYIFTYMQRKKF